MTIICSKVFFDDLGMPKPDIYMGIGSGSHAYQTGTVMIEFEKICQEKRSINGSRSWRCKFDSRLYDSLCKDGYSMRMLKQDYGHLTEICRRKLIES